MGESLIASYRCLSLHPDMLRQACTLPAVPLQGEKGLVNNNTARGAQTANASSSIINTTYLYTAMIQDYNTRHAATLRAQLQLAFGSGVPTTTYSALTFRILQISAQRHATL